MSELDKRETMIKAVEEFEEKYGKVLVDFRKSNKLPLPYIPNKENKRMGRLWRLFGGKP